MTFKFIDLYAGIGGFHAALSAAGGTCVFASEIDEKAAEVYERNWGIKPFGDIRQAITDQRVQIPDHDILAAGFPCQPFSKSGLQLGMEDVRGTHFSTIARILEAKSPKVVLLENVRNLAGPRHIEEWDLIISTLRNFGYTVSAKPLILSPHAVRPEYGGTPQHRERLFIVGTLASPGKRSGENFSNLGHPNLSRLTNPKIYDWDILQFLSNNSNSTMMKESVLSADEILWIDAWSDFVRRYVKTNRCPLPGFPLWVDSWKPRNRVRISGDTPKWKRDFILKNTDFYARNSGMIENWLLDWDVKDTFPSTRRKLEWQAGTAQSLWECIVQFRPSGVRAKPPTHVPTLVAMNQNPVIGPLRRKLNVNEALRLQGFPKWFEFGDQAPAISMKQLGNAVNVSVAYHILHALFERDIGYFKKDSKLGLHLASSRTTLKPRLAK